MIEVTCATVRERLPDLAAGRLAEADRDGVVRHVEACAECRAELEVARMVFESRPQVPAGFLDRLTSRVVDSRRPQNRPWWAAAAAAVAAIALGIGMASQPAGPAQVDVPGYAYEVEEGDIWLSDDGLVAGAPLFDDLSDDALLQLLDEISVGSAGGAA